MKTRILWMLPVLACCLAMGCKPVYLQGIKGNAVPIAIVPKKGVDVKETWVSAGSGSAGVFNDYNENRNTRIRLTRVHSEGSGVANFGLQAWEGCYTAGLYGGKGRYRYYGFAPDVTVLKRGYIAGVGIGLGLFAAVFAEFGEYTDFRRKMYKNDLTDSNDNYVSMTMSVFPWLDIPLPFGFRSSYIPVLSLNAGLFHYVSINYGRVLVWYGWQRPAYERYNSTGLYQAQRVGVAFRL